VSLCLRLIHLLQVIPTPLQLGSTLPPSESLHPVSRLYDRSFACAFFSQIGFVLSNTLMTHYARWIDFLGGDVEQVGIIMGAGAVVGLLLRPGIGQCIDRIGARNVWLLGYLIFGAGAAANLGLTDLGFGIYFCRSLLVLGAAFVFSSSLAYITHHAPPERRTEAIGILGVGGFIGMILGPVLGDVILGDTRSTENFQTLFAVSVASLVLPALLLFFLEPPATETRQPAARLTDFFRTIKRCWPGMIILVVATFGLCMTVPFVFLAKYIDEVGLSIPGVSEMGLFFFCYAGWGLTVRIWSRKIPDRLGRRKMLLVGCIVMGSGMFLFPWVDAEHPWRLAAPALLCGTGHALMFHTATSLFLHTFPAEVRGVGSALSLMVLDLGMIAGAPVLGYLAFHFGYEWLFRSVGATCFVTGTLYAFSSVPVWKARLETAGAESSS
jgi:MFS family permease